MLNMKTDFGCWQKLSSTHSGKDSASSRVGHTAHYLSASEKHSWILLVGGANRASCCSNYLLLNLRTGSMLSAIPLSSNADPLFARYEHASALCDGELVLFGGANQNSPFSDVWSVPIDVCPLSSGNATDLTVAGFFAATPSRIQPANADSVSGRTQHTSSCLTEVNELIVFAGGALGSTPVDDAKVYMYMIKEKEWITVETEGCAPSPRLGHLMLYQPPDPRSEKKTNGMPGVSSFFVHGGMSGEEFFDDFYRLELHRPDAALGGQVRGTWHAVRTTGGDAGSPLQPPPPRAAHGGGVIVSPLFRPQVHCRLMCRVFVFGGLNSSGPLNDFYYFDEVACQWVRVSGMTSSTRALPSPRLDFAFTTLRMQVRDPTRKRACVTATFSEFEADWETSPADGDQNEAVPMVWRNFLFIHGGMNAGQNIFGDAYICCLDEQQTEEAEKLAEENGDRKS
nr:unnamed protein product [Spirometra erinaceieuropaei]